MCAIYPSRKKHTERVLDLEYQGEVIIFVPLFTTFEASVTFRGS